MKKITLTLTLICMSAFVFGQQQQFNNDNRALYTYKIEHYHKMKSGGQILTFGGSALFAIGLATIISGANSYDNNNNTSTTDNGLNGTIVGGVVMYVAGIGCVGAGVPLWVVGGINQGRYERKLDSLSFKLKVNPQSAGIALCYKF
jgi:hypothetical protein